MSRKRSSGEVLDEDHDVAAAKRVRHAPSSADANESQAGFEGFEEIEAHRGVKRSAAGAVGYEDGDDDDDDEDEDDDDEDEEDAPNGSTAAGSNRVIGEDSDEGSGSDGEGMSAEQMDIHRRSGHAFAGVLESVRLDRFMSHNCFEYKLGPNVNIINGPNGSGKSAIVAAVQIGLGARASATERASKIDDHIMYSKDTAVITIKIRNRVDPDEASARDGDHSGRASSRAHSGDSSTFRHAIYGDTIIVERTLRRGRPSLWKVQDKSANSVLKHLPGITARAEVQNICDHYGIMVDNPVAVLTQTATKKFLAQCKPRHHFELFQKATRLGPLNESLQTTQNACEGIHAMLKQKRKSLPAVEKQLEDLRIAMENSQEMKNMSKSIYKDSVAFAWARADETSQLLARWEDQMKNEFEAALEETLQKEAKILESFDPVNLEMAEVDSKLKEATAKTHVARGNLSTCTKQFELQKREVARKKNELLTLKSEILVKENIYRDAEKRLIDARQAHDQGQSHKSGLADELEGVNEQLERAVQESLRAEDKARGASEALEMARSRTSSLQEKLRNIEEAHDQKRHQAAQQRRNAENANHVGRFGNRLMKVMPRIEQLVRERKFHEPPIGPVGQFITVKEDFWAATIQDVIHYTSLTTFLVGDRHDFNLLKRCFADCNAGKPRAIVIQGGLGQPRHTIPANCIPQIHHLGHHTVLDKLNVQHDAVFNMLVDFSRVEANVLVRGTDAMADLSRVHTPQVQTWWDEKGNRAYMRNGSHAYRPSERRGAGCVLSSNRMAYVRGLEDEARALGAERADTSRDLGELQREIRDKQCTVRECAAEAQRARSADSRLREVAKDLELRISEAATEFDASPFQADIDNCRRDAEELRREFTGTEKIIEELGKSVAASQVERDRAQNTFELLRNKIGSLKEQLENLCSSIAKDKAALRRISADKTQHERVVQQAHREIADKRADYAKVADEARKLSAKRPPVEEGMTAKKFEDRIAKNKARLAEEENRHDGKCAQQIETEYLKAKGAWNDNQELMVRIESYASCLEKGLDRRMKQKKATQALLRKQVRNLFNLFLGTKGHKGRLSFPKSDDTGKVELRISMQMATHKTGDGALHQTTDLKSLSGGERSYATLSFMMSLADATQNPVRILDEPDVFMDEASRHAAFGSLIEMCTTQLSDRQIVLVTPLTLPRNVKITDSVRIVRLSAVSRGGSGQPQGLIDDYLPS